MKEVKNKFNSIYLLAYMIISGVTGMILLQFLNFGNPLIEQMMQVLILFVGLVWFYKTNKENFFNNFVKSIVLILFYVFTLRLIAKQFEFRDELITLKEGLKLAITYNNLILIGLVISIGLLIQTILSNK